MTRLILTFITCLLLNTQASASINMFVGASVGAFSGDTKVIEKSGSNIGSIEAAATGESISFLTGVELERGHYYLAGEVFGGFTNASSTNYENTGSVDDFVDTVKIRSIYGGALLPGYIFSNGVIIFTRVGISGARFTVTESLPNTNPQPSTAPSIFTKSSTHQVGLQLGGGTKIPLNDEFSLRFDYIFTKHHNFSNNVFASAKAKFKPTSNEAKVSILFNPNRVIKEIAAFSHRKHNVA